MARDSTPTPAQTSGRRRVIVADPADVRLIRSFLVAEGSLFLFGIVLHLGLIDPAYEHARTVAAEFVIAAILFGGLGLSLTRDTSPRLIGLIVQSVAVIGTALGWVMIAIGVGPRSVVDFVLYAVMLAVLGAGFLTTRRLPPESRAE